MFDWDFGYKVEGFGDQIIHVDIKVDARCEYGADLDIIIDQIFIDGSLSDKDCPIYGNEAVDDAVLKALGEKIHAHLEGCELFRQSYLESEGIFFNQTRGEPWGEGNWERVA